MSAAAARVGERRLARERPWVPLRRASAGNRRDRERRWVPLPRVGERRLARERPWVPLRRASASNRRDRERPSAPLRRRVDGVIAARDLPRGAKAPK